MIVGQEETAHQALYECNNLEFVERAVSGSPMNAFVETGPLLLLEFVAFVTASFGACITFIPT